MSAALANFSLAVAILLAGVAFALMLVGIVSFVRLRHGSMLWISVAFALLLGQGVWYALEAYAARDDPVFPTMTLVTLAVVLALYAAVLKR